MCMYTCDIYIYIYIYIHMYIYVYIFLFVPYIYIYVSYREPFGEKQETQTNIFHEPVAKSVGRDDLVGGRRSSGHNRDPHGSTKQ